MSAEDPQEGARPSAPRLGGGEPEGGVPTQTARYHAVSAEDAGAGDEGEPRAPAPAAGEAEQRPSAFAADAPPAADPPGSGAVEERSGVERAGPGDEAAEGNAVRAATDEAVPRPMVLQEALPPALSDERRAGDIEVDAEGLANLSGAHGRVAPVNLFASQRRVDRSFPGLNIVLDRTANALTDDLARSFRTTAEVYASPPETLKLQDYRKDLPQPSVAVQLVVDGLGCRAMLALEFSLLLQLLEHRFGGGKLPAKRVLTPRMRARFSQVEEQLVEDLVYLFCRCMERGWQRVLPTRARPGPLEYKLSNVRIAADADEILSCAFELVVGRIQGTLHFALPLEAVELNKDALDDAGGGSMKDGSATWQQALERNLLGVPMTAVAELGRVEISLAELLGLKPGDVVRLDQPADEPLRVLIGGGYSVRGTPCTRHGNLAVQITTMDRGGENSRQEET